MKKTSNKERVRLDELGLYLRTVELDYKPVDNKERAELISELFNVVCYEEDVDHYEQLTHSYQEFIDNDWDLESRREEYCKALNIINPFN
jgi:hypothetical protein